MEIEIIPAVGQEKKTAQILLGLAVKPRHVRIAHEGGMSFFVPEYLNDLYELHLSGQKSDETDSSAPIGVDSPVAARRRGRPPKPRPEGFSINQDKE